MSGQESNPAVALLRSQFNFAHNSFVEGTMQGLTSDNIHVAQPGKAMPIGALYAHIVTSEDMLLNGLLRGQAPICASSFAGKTGLSAMPPTDTTWDQWAKSLKVDLPQTSAYAKAVFSGTDEYLASLTDADLQRPLDLSMIGMGQQNVAVLLNLLLSNAFAHSGEISALKGLQGLQGYPF